VGSYLNKLFDLSRKVVIITGAAGQLGGEFTRVLLKAGASVAAFDIWLDNPKGRLKEIKSKKLFLVKVDITKKNSIKKGLKKVIQKLGDPNVLINNAALDTPPHISGDRVTTFENFSERFWEKVMEVNLKGMFLCCQVIGGYMAKKRGGSIINISSVYGMLSPDQRIYEYKEKPFYKPVVYSVSKAGVLNFTRYLATYWAKKNIRVNTLTFGGVFNHQDERFIKNYSQKVPLGRMAKQDEYNGAVIFLASDASSYMTGSNLVIDGVYSCW